MAALPLPTFRDLLSIHGRDTEKVSMDLLVKFHEIKMRNLDFLSDVVNENKGFIEDMLTKYENQRVGQEVLLESINGRFATLTGVRAFLLKVAAALPSSFPEGSDFGFKASALLKALEGDLAASMETIHNQLDFAFALHPMELRWDGEKGGYYLSEPNEILQSLSLSVGLEA